MAGPSHQMDALQPWVHVCSALCLSGSFILVFELHTEEHVKNTSNDCRLLLAVTLSAAAPVQTPAGLAGETNPLGHPGCPSLALRDCSSSPHHKRPLRKGRAMATVTEDRNWPPQSPLNSLTFKDLDSST